MNRLIREIERRIQESINTAWLAASELITKSDNFALKRDEKAPRCSGLSHHPSYVWFGFWPHNETIQISLLATLWFIRAHAKTNQRPIRQIDYIRWVLIEIPKKYWIFCFSKFIKTRPILTAKNNYKSTAISLIYGCDIIWMKGESSLTGLIAAWVIQSFKCNWRAQIFTSFLYIFAS